jgi:hypothetical protein
LLFIGVIVLPDLHRLAAARARIAFAGKDDALLSLALGSQCGPLDFRLREKHERSQNASVREIKQSQNGN